MKLYIKDGVIKQKNKIVIKRDGKQYINPTEELILSDGWEVYIPYVPKEEPYIKTVNEVVQELVVRQWNERTDIPNKEALDYRSIVFPWDDYIGKVLAEGRLVAYDEKIWRARQTHTALEVYPPSINTASLYEVIEIEHDGTLDDPIPYTPPMEIFNGKYYIQNDVLYLCTRDSGTALSHNLKDLINIYVIKV